jgi:hypothetical protein
MGQDLACSAGYYFSIWRHGEAFPKLGVQSADVSALPSPLTQPRVPPVSQQSPWFTELRRSVAVSQLPSLTSQVFVFEI